MSLSPIDPKCGFVSKQTLTVPAGGYIQLPRPIFTGDTPRALPRKPVALLYEFAGDNTAALELVVSEDDTLGTTIAASTPWQYGGFALSMCDGGYYRYLYNASGGDVDVTVTLTRLV